MTLIKALERHRSACILAVSANNHYVLLSVLSTATEVKDTVEQIQTMLNLFTSKRSRACFRDEKKERP
jgi:hypothetical protein